MSRAHERGPRILVVRLAGIGDVAVASALVGRIRAEQPAASVSFLTGRAAAPIARLFDVDEVIEADERALLRGGVAERGAAFLALWQRLARGRFQRVLLLHVDRRYRALTAGMPWATVDMLTRRVHGEMLPIPGRWLGDEYARLLDGNVNVGPIERRYEMADLRARVPADARGAGAVVLVPGGAANVLRDDALRRWPVEHYAALAGSLIAAGRRVVLVGGPGDHWVLPAFEGLAVESLIGGGSIVDTLAVLRAAALVVSHDTGPMHLARLVRAPLLALFGPTVPAQVLSVDDSVTVLWGGAQLACRPCFDGREFARCANNLCLSSVSPQTVFETAMRRLASAPAPAPAGAPAPPPASAPA